MKKYIYSLVFLLAFLPIMAEESAEKYSIFELTLNGSKYGPEDNPVRDILLETTWVHESGEKIRGLGANHRPSR